MAISAHVKSQYFHNNQELIRIDPSPLPPNPTAKQQRQSWTDDEHERFLEALELFPTGPWKLISAYVGTRTTRQTMTHAQKYREKIARRKKSVRFSSFLSKRVSTSHADEIKKEQAGAVAAKPSEIRVPASPISLSSTAEQMTVEFVGELDIDDVELLSLLSAAASGYNSSCGFDNNVVSSELLSLEDVDVVA